MSPLDRDVSERLKSIISESENYKRISGGEIFLSWGILNTVSALLVTFVWTSIWIWIIMIALGITIQFFFMFAVYKKEKASVRGGRFMVELWTVIVILTVFTTLILPSLGIFNNKDLYASLYLLVGLGTYVSGMISKNIFLKIGALFSFTAALLIGLNLHWLFPALSFSLGSLVFPGILSILNKEEKE